MRKGEPPQLVDDEASPRQGDAARAQDDVGPAGVHVLDHGLDFRHGLPEGGGQAPADREQPPGRHKDGHGRTPVAGSSDQDVPEKAFAGVLVVGLDLELSGQPHRLPQDLVVHRSLQRDHFVGAPAVEAHGQPSPRPSAGRHDRELGLVAVAERVFGPEARLHIHLAEVAHSPERLAHDPGLPLELGRVGQGKKLAAPAGRGLGAGRLDAVRGRLLDRDESRPGVAAGRGPHLGDLGPHPLTRQRAGNEDRESLVTAHALALRSSSMVRTKVSPGRGRPFARLGMFPFSPPGLESLCGRERLRGPAQVAGGPSKPRAGGEGKTHSGRRSCRHPNPALLH